MKANSWIIGIVGLWIVASSFVSDNIEFVLWSNVTSGLIVAIAGFSMVKVKPEFGWVAGIFGIWMLFIPFVTTLHTDTGLMWNGIIAGFIAALDGFSSLASKPPKTVHE